jgi:hypothetical protein
LADYPCDWHLSRYKGPSYRFFLSVYKDERAIVFRAAVCSDCYLALAQPWAEHALHKTAGGYFDPPEDEPEPETLWIDAPRPENRVLPWERAS